MKKIMMLFALLSLALCLLSGCYPKGRTDIPEWMWPNSPPTKDEEESMTVSAGLEYVSWHNGTCYVYRMGTCRDTELIIPQVAPNGDRVIAIDEKAFQDYTELKSVVLPEGLEKIGKSAFAGCEQLATIRFPESLRQIGERAFEDCKSLREIHIPAKVVYIGDLAFEGCRRLKQASFDRTDGWQATLGSYGDWYGRLEKEVLISSEAISTPAGASGALKDTYVYYIWTRN